MSRKAKPCSGAPSYQVEEGAFEDVSLCYGFDRSSLALKILPWDGGMLTCFDSMEDDFIWPFG